jgi:hypothetical protein
MNRNSKGNGIAGQLLRTRYYPRQLLTAAELTTDQEYFRERLRRHNRLLHGCGVVCGLEVVRDPDATDALRVIITPGYALSPQGDEIYVPGIEKFKIDAAQNIAIECEDVDVQPPSQSFYLAIRYVEQGVRPDPSLPEHCAPTSTWEYSRIRSGYEIACLNELPESHHITKMDWQEVWAELCHRTAPESLDNIHPFFQCTPETSDPWAVLAGLHLSPEGRLKIDYGPRCQNLSTQLIQELCAIMPFIGQPGKEEEEMLTLTKTAKIASGKSLPQDWKDHISGGKIVGIGVNVDTSASGFSKTPTYITSIHGVRSHWNLIGGCSVYDARPTGFTIYVQYWDDKEKNYKAPSLTEAKDCGWHIQWIGIED